jgi:hypothetical protein
VASRFIILHARIERESMQQQHHRTRRKGEEAADLRGHRKLLKASYRAKLDTLFLGTSNDTVTALAAD